MEATAAESDCVLQSALSGNLLIASRLHHQSSCLPAFSTARCSLWSTCQAVSCPLAPQHTSLLIFQDFTHTTLLGHCKLLFTLQGPSPCLPHSYTLGRTKASSHCVILKAFNYTSVLAPITVWPFSCFLHWGKTDLNYICFPCAWLIYGDKWTNDYDWIECRTWVCRKYFCPSPSRP